MAKKQVKVSIEVPADLQVKSGAKGIEFAVRVYNDELQDLGKGKTKPMGVTFLALLGSFENGRYNAPVVETEIEDTITVSSRAKPGISKEFQVKIVPDPFRTPPTPPPSPRIRVPSRLEIQSGAVLKIPAHVENSGKGYGFIVSAGRVDTNGVFYAPRVASDEQVTITVTSLEFPNLTETFVVTVKAETLKIRINVPTMGLSVVSGSKIHLPVSVDGDVWNSTTNDYYGLSIIPVQGRMEGGNYIAPDVDQPADDMVEVRSNYDPAYYSSFYIHVEPKPTKATSPPKVPVIIIPRGLEVSSGGKIRLNAVVENSTKDVTFSTTVGRIDDGKNFQAPRVYTDQNVFIRVESIEFPNLWDLIPITIKAFKIVIGNRITDVAAGSSPVNLNIKVENDPDGFYNFTCVLISGEGEITENGIYTPPKHLTPGGVVTIEITSTSDGNVKLQYSFLLTPVKCRVCDEELDLGTGQCPYGHNTGFSTKPAGRPEKSRRMKRF